MKLFLMLAAIYALILNQSLKQKERQSIPAQVNMQTTPKPQKIEIQPGNTYINTSFHTKLTDKPAPKRKMATEKRNFPVKSYQPNPFQKENDPKDINENILQDVFYPMNYSSSSSLANKDGSR